MKRKTLLFFIFTSLLVFIVIMVLSPTKYNKEDFKEGDIIFQTSQSRQSKLIAYATSSFDTHCGIIICEGSKKYVLEASNVVKLTPLDKFIGKGLFRKFHVSRYTEKPVKISYRNYLGLPYDSQFSWTDKQYYCSELVWKIYKNQLGVELCSPSPLSKYTTFGIEDKMKKRGISRQSLFVAPSDIAKSNKLKRI